MSCEKFCTRATWLDILHIDPRARCFHRLLAVHHLEVGRYTCRDGVVGQVTAAVRDAVRSHLLEARRARDRVVHGGRGAHGARRRTAPAEQHHARLGRAARLYRRRAAETREDRGGETSTSSRKSFP